MRVGKIRTSIVKWPVKTGSWVSLVFFDKRKKSVLIIRIRIDKLMLI